MDSYLISTKGTFASQKLLQIVSKVNSSHLMQKFIARSHPVIISGEVRPSQAAPVIAQNKSQRLNVFPMVWGFTFQTGINTRSTFYTIDYKQIQRHIGKKNDELAMLWAKQRCVIPCSWYHEVILNQKYLVQPRGCEEAWLAGLYRIEEELPVFVIIEAEVNDFICDKMPCFLHSEAIRSWIRNDCKDLLGISHQDIVYERIQSI